ncbi:hypothetical protein [Microbacterium candidum]|uniref:DUF4142 domain-containing protein n=1 Tax=Microbacterium candidum TaxID=3041922 RepID=A0ABT7MV30_9MICO|nr:hypothetical protein [Microbacterium sp. ASV49]MDL9978312.1 hypothetical protein [Microbacterium sp. ASV49]
MSISHARLFAVSVLAAGAIVLPAAIAYSSSPATPSPSTTKASISATSAEFAALAASAGISESRLQDGLVAAKKAGGNNPDGVTAFAAATGVSPATSQRVVTSVFGEHVDRSITGPSAADALAARLGVSAAAAQSALHRIAALSGKDGVDPGSPGFAAIAHDLGTTPAGLASALDAMKRVQAGK